MKPIVRMKSAAPTNVKPAPSGGQTKSQKSVEAPEVSAAAKAVTPMSGPTIRRPSQQNECRPCQACHTLIDGTAWSAVMCSGTTCINRSGERCARISRDRAATSIQLAGAVSTVADEGLRA
jgi:hypothetical protein